MARNIVQNFTRENKPVRNYEEETKKIQEARTIIQNLKREVIKPKTQTLRREQPRIPTSQLLTQVKAYTSSPDNNYYLGFGGLGDALLLLAECWEDTQAKVVFFANSQPFVGSFFNLFGRSIFLHDNIMGSSVAGVIFDYMKSLPTFKQSAHLADGLNYGDWVNEAKYIPRIKNSVPWIAYLGKEKYDRKVLILAPSGSNKDHNRQRHLTPHEYRTLTSKYLAKDYQVFSVGSIADFHYYGIVNHPNCNWLSSEIIYSNVGAAPTNLLKMLQIIHAADMVISTDTFLKTYTLLCGIPTTVIRTRWNGHYRNYGTDVTDWIFLNRNIWPNLKLETLESLL